MKLGELKEFDAAEALKDDETIRHYLPHVVICCSWLVGNLAVSR